MPFIPVPGGVGLCFEFTTDGQQWQVCLTLKRNTGSPSTAELQSLADAGAAWWTADLSTLLTSATRLRQVLATDLTFEGAPQRFNAINTVGSGPGNALPLNSCIVVSFRTALRGRSFRGRNYVSGIPDTWQATPNTAVAFNVGLLGAIYATLVTTILGLGYSHVVASKQHNGAVVNPATTQAVTLYVTDIDFDSQRRRLTGRGT